MPGENDKKEAQTTDKRYSELADVAYKTAYSITNTREDSEDIAQLVTMRLYLHEERIEPDSARNWVITTAKNESYLKLQNNKKEVYKNGDSFADYEQQITDSLIKEEDKQKEVELLLNKLKNNFPEHERSMLEKYFLEGKKLSRIYSKKGIKVKKNTFYQRIYRLRKEVRAQHCRQKGMKASKDIVSFNLNQSIMRFIRKYKECLDNKSFVSMTKYFQEIGIPESVPGFNIKEIIDYDIQLLDNNEYEIIVYFVDKRKSMEIFSTVFSLNDQKNIAIHSIPNNEEMSHWCIIDEKALNENFLNNIEEFDEKGYSQLNYDNDVETNLNNIDKSGYRIKEIKTPRNVKLKDED